MKKIKTKENAIGIILLEKLNYKIKINPIVWVKTVDTLYYETACGSGSLATAIYTSYIEKENTFEIIQPSNYSIFVELNIEKEIIKNAKLLGKIVESR